MLLQSIHLPHFSSMKDIGYTVSSTHSHTHTHTHTHTHSERRFVVPEEKTTSMSVK